jgi:hypothetical protein
VLLSNGHSCVLPWYQITINKSYALYYQQRAPRNLGEHHKAIFGRPLFARSFPQQLGRSGVVERLDNWIVLPQGGLISSLSGKADSE